MANEINPIMARFANEPALLREDQASLWLQSCCQVISAHSAEIKKIEASSDFWFSSDDWRSAYRPYNVKEGILTIPVKGVLLNNFSIALGTFATGYDYIWQAVKRGMDDREVKGIVFSVDSGGGMVSGNLDLVDRIYAMRGTKPMRAHTTEGAYSAAYSIASAADRIVVSRSGGVGSIGVVTVHGEYSKMLEKQGVTITIVRSKPRKMEGNGYEPLTDTAREAMQSRIDAMHTEFVAIVARNRGMTEAEVDATNAECFAPKDAIERKLADEIGNADDAFAAFAASVNPDKEKAPMADDNKAVITEEAHAAAVTAATVQGSTTERARISAILGSDVAKERPVAAQMFAFDMDMSAEDAVAKLAKLPVEAKAESKPEVAATGAGAGAAAFTAAMGNTSNPEIQAENGTGESGAEETQAARILRMAASSGLKGFAAK